MGEINNGILGSFSGRVGPVSGYTRYGRNIMRTAASNVRDKPTPLRMAQREKIKVCNTFINAFTGKGIFSKTFPNYGHGGSGYNRAMGVLMNKALAGTYPSFTIAYENFLVSSGPMPEARNATAVVTAEGDIQFNWIDNTGEGTAKATDKVILVAYLPATNAVIFSLDAGKRTDGSAILTTGSLKGYIAETWMGFLSKDDQHAANSVYTGSVVG